MPNPDTIAVSPQSLMQTSSVPAVKSFLSLPAELRIAIYKAIIEVNTMDVINIKPSIFAMEKASSSRPASETQEDSTPTVVHLASSSGFILSCKQVKAEFENEWCTAFNGYLRSNWGHSPLFHIYPVTKLSDSVCLEIALCPLLEVPDPSPSSSSIVWPWTGDGEITKAVHDLSRHLPSFRFSPGDNEVLRYLRSSVQFHFHCQQAILSGWAETGQDQGMLGYIWEEVARKSVIETKKWRGLTWEPMIIFKYIYSRRSGVPAA